MIEFLGSMTLLLIAAIGNYFQLPEKILLLNASIFILLAFIIFARLFKQLVYTRLISTKQRSFWTVITCIMYVCFSCLCTMYFCDVSKNNLSLVQQNVLYWSLYLLLLLAHIANIIVESIYNLVYGIRYRIFFLIQETLMMLCVTLNIIYDSTSIFWIIICLLSLIGILRLLGQRLKPYWLHKESFYSEFKAILQRNKEKDIVNPVEKSLEENSFFRELRYLTDYSIFRPLELVFLLDSMQRMLKKANRPKIDTAEFLANFARIFVYNLMRRDKDFNIKFSFIYENIIKHFKPRDIERSKNFNWKI